MQTLTAIFLVLVEVNDLPEPKVPLCHPCFITILAIYKHRNCATLLQFFISSIQFVSLDLNINHNEILPETVFGENFIFFLLCLWAFLSI